jgi:hypothetical protein
MRRALRAKLPALAYHFCIRPWEVDDLTYGEIVTFLDALSDLNESG